jgi:hypothetical protein
LAEFGCFNQRILGKTIQFPLIKEYIARETNGKIYNVHGQMVNDK